MWWSETKRLAAATLLIASLAGSGLAGCGFQFSGSAGVSARLEPVYVDTVDRYSPFYRALVIELRRDDVQLTEEPSVAQTVIKILADDTGRRLLSVTARNVPAEYEVYYLLRFSVDGKEGELVPIEQLALTRDFAFDETRVLGKVREEEQIREAIANDLVRLVMRRLNAIP